LNGLQPDTTYHFRACASNSKGTSYGSDKTFTTDQDINIPSVTTNTPTNVEPNSATLNGNLDNMGGASSCQVNFEYGISVSYGSQTSAQTKYSTGGFTANASNLEPGTTYHFRARATNSAGTGYGSDRTFTTPVEEPSVITLAATDVEAMTTTLNGQILEDGGATCQYSFKYGVKGTGNYDQTVWTGPVSSDDFFSELVSDLEPKTDYECFAGAKNSAGEVWGNKVEFTTKKINHPPEIPDPPVGPTVGYLDISYEFTAVTTDPDGDPLDFMFMWEDGVFSDWIGAVGSGVPITETYSWSLVGDYEVKVKARDIEGLESDWSDPLYVTIYDPSTIDRYALVVGEWDYPGSSSDIPNSYHNAFTVYSHLDNAEEWMKSNMRFRINQGAANITSDLLWMESQDKEESISLFYYSGHGSQIQDDDGDEADGQDEILYCSDGNYIRDDDLKEMLDAYEGRVVVILEACHSGGMPLFWGGGYGDNGIIGEISGDNRVIISACAEDEGAWYFDDGYPSFFTYFMCEGWDGFADMDNDAIITEEETFYYARDTFLQWQNDNIPPWEQNPQMVDGGADVIPLICSGFGTNFPPAMSESPSPYDGENNVPTQVELSCTVDDMDSELLCVAFFFENGEEDVFLGYDFEIVPGTRASLQVNSLLPNTTYEWYVKVTDGIDYTNSQTWTFTTTDSQVLSADSYLLEQSTGGVVNFALNAGQDNASRNYILVGGITGTTPGTPLPGGYVTLPLNMDLFSDLVLSLLNTPVFMDFMGVLDSMGRATAQMNTFGPLPPDCAGLDIFFAFACKNPWDFVSNPIAIKIHGQSNWWDPSYASRKELHVTDASFDYQMRITVYKQDGHDDPEAGIIDCEDHCKADFSDLRFIDGELSDPLPYWIEETGIEGDHDFAHIWVKTSGSSSIFMYYQNPFAEPASDGESTFLLFDDFEDESLDMNKWYVYKHTAGSGSSGYEEAGGQLRLYSNSSHAGELIEVHSHDVFASGTKVIGKIKTAFTEQFRHRFGFNDGNYSSTGTYFEQASTPFSKRWYCSDGGAYTWEDIDFDTKPWNCIEIHRIDATNCVFKREGSDDALMTSAIPTHDLGVLLYCWEWWNGDMAELYAEHVCVGKAVHPEPLWDLFREEETY